MGQAHRAERRALKRSRILESMQMFHSTNLIDNDTLRAHLGL